MNYLELTQDEQDIIKQYRKNKMELKIIHMLREDNVVKDTETISFSVNDNKIHMSTQQRRDLSGEFHNASGFFSCDFYKDDVIRIKEFIEVFLS